MTESFHHGTVLVCEDGSEGCRQAVTSIAHLVVPKRVVILTVWQPLITRLARAGGFALLAPGASADLDGPELDAAHDVVKRAAERARDLGFDPTTRVERSEGPVWEAIIDVAQEIGAQLILCGTRGRGGVASTFLGSTSHALLRHAHRPVLLAPKPTEA